jgi:hypothetical protein
MKSKKTERKSPHSKERNEKKGLLITARNKAIREEWNKLKEAHPNKRLDWYCENLQWKFYLDKLYIKNILYGFNRHAQSTLFAQPHE